MIDTPGRTDAFDRRHSDHACFIWIGQVPFENCTIHLESAVPITGRAAPDGPAWMAHFPFGFGVFHLDSAIFIWIGQIPFENDVIHLDWALSIRIRGPPFRLRMFHLDPAGSIRE